MYNPKLHFHFTGIGGSGMSGIAEILLGLSFAVSGTDEKPSAVCERLISKGAQIHYGHSAEHLPSAASLLVYSSAVCDSNPEIQEAKRRKLPVVRRAEVLAELMRLKFGIAVAGAHGKTTTTSMIAAVLEAGALDPTVVIGGLVKSIGSGGKMGKGAYLVAESDESDKSFLLLKPTIAVVTNIDAEHLNAYGSMQELEASFEQFVAAVPFYGLAVLCADDARVKTIAQERTIRKITYGVSPDAELRAEDIRPGRGATTYTVVLRGEKLFDIRLPMYGAHMALNSLAAIAVGLELGIGADTIRGALENFAGVGRRLETIGEVAGVTVMSDYGHHPTEIRATLRALKAAGEGIADSGRVHVVFQPHRYSRTRDCFAQFIDAFGDADRLVLSDIYPAGEAPIDGVSGALLFDAIRHPLKEYVEAPELAIAPLCEACTPGDVILCLGAGSVGSLPERIIEKLSLKSSFPRAA